MNFNLRLRSWSHHRQLLDGAGKSLPEVIRAVCGVYSPHPSGPLSLAARCKAFRPEDFQKLDSEKLALRMPAMRGSVHLLDRETGPRIVAAVLPGPEDPGWAKRYSQPGRDIPAEHYPAWMEEILQVAKEPMTVAELKKKLTVVPDEKLKFVLNRMGYERKILRYGDARIQANIIGYVNPETWLGEAIPLPGEEESLAWLAGEYLRAFGPARIKDFKWWTGLTAGKVKAAFATLDLVEVEKGYFLNREDAAAFEKHDSDLEGVVDLLPQWDCYVMGYAPDGRQRFVHPDFQPQVYGKLGATRGNGLGTILVAGNAEGIWFSRLKGKAMEVELQLFGKLSKPIRKKLDVKLEEVAGWMGADSVVMTL